MINSHKKNFGRNSPFENFLGGKRLGLGVLVASWLLSTVSFAQEPPQELPGPEDIQPETPETFNLIVNGRNVVVDREGEFRQRYITPATGAPLSIAPTPYVDEEVLGDPISVLAQQGIPLGELQEEELREDELPDDAGEDLFGRPNFEEADLNPLTADSIGLLMPGSEGYPLDLWDDSRADAVLRLLARLPDSASSPTPNNMKHRLLLSAAPYPEDMFGRVSAEDFLYARLERLYAAGDLESVLRLFEQIPRAERSPRITRLMVNAYLLDGDLETGCALAEQGQRAEGSGAWLKITAVCLALDGKEAEARFNITLLEETGEADFAFLTLFEDVVALVREQTRPDTRAMESAPATSFFAGNFYLLSDLTPLHVGILKVLNRRIDISLDGRASPNIVLASLTRWPGLSLETKLNVADLAITNGILDDRFLENLVGAYTFSESDKQAAHLLDYESWGVKSDALFYSLAREAFDSPEAIRHIQEGWSRARVGGRAPFIARLYLDAMKEIPANANYMAFAPDAVRISLLTGNWNIALDWYNLVRGQAATGDPEATRMLVEMWPMMVTMSAGDDIPYSPQILTLWRQSLSLLPPEEQLARASLLYEVLEVLDHKVPRELRDERLLTGSHERPDFDRGRSMGETILLVLNAFGEDGTHSLTPAALAAIMETMIDERMEADARLFALESLLARGF